MGELLLALAGRHPHPLFDPRFYLERRPDVARSGANPLLHYLRRGATEGSDPHPLFDSRFYLEQRPDVARSGANPLVDYLRHGATNGSDPHPLFDRRYYLERRPDAVRSGANPVVHYLHHGSTEGSDPHPLFDGRFYLAAHPDVAEGGLNPLVHFLQYGAARRFDPHPLFSCEYYLSRHPDVAASGQNPLVHFVRRGAFEGGDPHPLFDLSHYLRRHPDARSGGANPLAHFLALGSAGRDPHPLFDAAFYVESGRAEIPEGVSPVLHYLEVGALEGRDPHPLFGTRYYSSRNPDVVRAGENPLVHYLRFGASEGRRPHPLFDPAYYGEKCRGMWDLQGTNALVHYLAREADEAPDPHPLFDTAYYVGLCRDEVRKAGNPLVHFVRQGARDGLTPSREVVSAAAPAARPEAGVAPLAARPDWSSCPVDLVAVGPTRGAADAWAAWAISSAAPATVEIAGLGLPAGFPACADAVNALAKEGRGSYLLLVRGSLEPGRSWVEPLLRAFQDLPCIGAVCATILAGPPHARDETAACAVTGGVRAVEALSSGGILVPRSLFLDLGGFDPAAASYEEAVARLSRRLREAGFEVYGHPHSALVGDEASAWTPTWRDGHGRVVAVVQDRPAMDEVTALIDPALVVLRLFLATGHQVVAWLPATAGGGAGATARRWESFGVDVVVGPGDRVPSAFFEGGPADAVLLDGSVGRGTLARIMALQPAARLVLLRAGPEPVADTSLLGHFDAVLSAGDLSRCAVRPDLSTEPPAPDAGAAGVRSFYVLGSERWPWALGQRPFVKALRRLGLASNGAWSARLQGQAGDLALLGRTEADIVVLGTIPWHYRRQRPQHLSAELGRRNRRVLYVEPDFLPANNPDPYRFVEAPEDNVFCVTLRAPQPADIHRRPPTAEQAAALGASLRVLFATIDVPEPTVVVQAPFWHSVCRGLAPSLLVYDCLDLYGAFPNVSPDVAALEEDLLRSADLVVFSAATLMERLPVGHRGAVVRNGCDYARFASARAVRTSDRITVGYVGAIDRWFDASLVNRCVEAFPQWEFVLAGSTAGLPSESLRPRPNLRLLGEVDYHDVPGLVAGWDVCLIPFADTHLTRCVNPVKVYEYLAAGRPVVATPLPELCLLEPGLVRLARAGEDFVRELSAAAEERDDAVLAARRREWASRQTWAARAEEFLELTRVRDGAPCRRMAGP
jgi:hypothetical protein